MKNNKDKIEIIKTFEHFKEFYKENIFNAIIDKRDNKYYWNYDSDWVCEDNYNYFVYENDYKNLNAKMIFQLIDEQKDLDFLDEFSGKKLSEIVNIAIADTCRALMHELERGGLIKDLHQQYYDIKELWDELNKIEDKIKELDKNDEDYNDDLEKLEEDLQWKREQVFKAENKLDALLERLEDRYEKIEWEDIQ